MLIWKGIIMKQVYETTTPQETYELAKRLARQACPGDIYCLDGDLGTGKTVFTQGFASGIGITEPVSSPTFTIICEYEGGRLPLYHFDVYRIAEPEEMDEIGYEDYFYGQGVTMVEWASLIEELIPAEAVRIRLEKDDSRGFDYRKITIMSRQRESRNEDIRD